MLSSTSSPGFISDMDDTGSAAPSDSCSCAVGHADAGGGATSACDAVEGLEHPEMDAGSASASTAHRNADRERPRPSRELNRAHVA
jgi:hypothetical protein